MDLDEKDDVNKGSQHNQLPTTMLDITTISWMEMATITGSPIIGNDASHGDAQGVRGCQRGTNICHASANEEHQDHI